jgi:hypothetical protein
MSPKAYKKLSAAGKKNPGGLHRSLHIPEGQKIPASRLTEALHSSNPKIRKQANLARVYKRMKH